MAAGKDWKHASRFIRRDETATLDDGTSGSDERCGMRGQRRRRLESRHRRRRQRERRWLANRLGRGAECGRGRRQARHQPRRGQSIPDFVSDIYERDEMWMASPGSSATTVSRTSPTRPRRCPTAPSSRSWTTCAPITRSTASSGTRRSTARRIPPRRPGRARAEPAQRQAGGRGRLAC
jgi:hypothetical protein